MSNSPANTCVRAGGGEEALQVPQQIPMQEKVYPEGLQPVGRPHTGAGEKREEEGAAKRSCYGLTTVTIPPCTALG